MEATEKQQSDAHELCLSIQVHCNPEATGEHMDQCAKLARGIAARDARIRAAFEKPIGQVLEAHGCDCDGEEPHGLMDCERRGHEPCAMHQVERALNAGLEAANG